MERTTYKITTVHPTGFQDGEHEVVVIVNPDGTRYVTGVTFGCSRDYSTPSNIVAIQNLLAEHGMRMTRIKNHQG